MDRYLGQTIQKLVGRISGAADKFYGVYLHFNSHLSPHYARECVQTGLDIDAIGADHLPPLLHTTIGRLADNRRLVARKSTPCRNQRSFMIQSTKTAPCVPAIREAVTGLHEVRRRGWCG